MNTAIPLFHVMNRTIDVEIPVYPFICLLSYWKLAFEQLETKPSFALNIRNSQIMRWIVNLFVSFSLRVFFPSSGLPVTAKHRSSSLFLFSLFNNQIDWSITASNWIWLWHEHLLIHSSFFFLCRTLGWTASWLTEIRSCSTDWGGHHCIGHHSERWRSSNYTALPQNQCSAYYRWPRSGGRCPIGHAECRYVRSECVGSVGDRTRIGKLLCHRTNGIGRQRCHFPWHCPYACGRWVQVSCP